MDTESVERCILLHCPESYSKHEIKSKFTSLLVGQIIFTVVLLVIWFAVLEAIHPYHIIAAVMLISLVAILTIKKLQHRILKIFKGKIDNKRVSISRNAAIAVAGMLLLDRFSRNNPEMYEMLRGTYLYAVLIGICIIFSITTQLYLMYLNKKYCPYLIIPEDARYNKDIKFWR